MVLTLSQISKPLNQQSVYWMTQFNLVSDFKVFSFWHDMQFLPPPIFIIFPHNLNLIQICRLLCLTWYEFYLLQFFPSVFSIFNYLSSILAMNPDGTCSSNRDCPFSYYHCCTGTKWCCPTMSICTGTSTCIGMGYKFHFLVSTPLINTIFML